MGIDAKMLVKHRERYTPEQVRDLAVDLAEAFGSDMFSIWAKEDSSWATEDRHALGIVDVYEQDGDDIVPQPDEQFIEVHLMGRYYGPGYERGNLPDYISIANWLEARIPTCSVFYGGDSSGVCAEPFDAKSRAQYWAHFCRVGHRPYTGAFKMTEATVMCTFCNRGMVDTGGGGGDTYFYCGGCGRKRIYLGKEQRVEKVEKNEDFFAAHHRIRGR